MDKPTLRPGILVLIDKLIVVLVCHELRVVAEDLLVPRRAPSLDEIF